LILKAIRLSKSYRAGARDRKWAIEDVSLEVPAGAFALFTGPSGSGKTTLLALLGGLERPTQGQALLFGRDLARCSGTELARLRRRLGFVFQDFALIRGLPVWENVTYPLVPRGVSRRARYVLAQDWLSRLGLGELLVRRPTELSGGEQQRVAIARALAGGPEVVLADEPTSNLDEGAASTVAELLRATHAEGKTIILATHDTRLAALATHVYALEGGRLPEVLRRPR
jgi:putative ABC transport system ATP-binding protein